MYITVALLLPEEGRESGTKSMEREEWWATMHNMKPRTLGPTAFWGMGADWELMWSAS